jgi:hypothetical protein
MPDPLREMFSLWGVWQELVSFLSTDRARACDPHTLFGIACSIEPDRLAALIYGHGIGQDLDEATELLEEVLDMAREGRRPRCGVELGLGPETFGLRRAA